MKTKLSQLLKDQARQSQPQFDPILHERILQAVRGASAARPRRRARPWRLPGFGLVLALAACVILALSVPLIFQNNPRLPLIANPQPAIDCPTPHAILALNIEPASQKLLDALSPEMAAALSSFDEIPQFFQEQVELIKASE
jgi:hypothetical protein